MIDAVISDCLGKIRAAANAVPMSRAGNAACVASSRQRGSSSSSSSSSSSIRCDIAVLAVPVVGVRAPLLPPPAPVPPRVAVSEALVTESQDIGVWEARYAENEAALKAAPIAIAAQNRSNVNQSLQQGRIGILVNDDSPDDSSEGDDYIDCSDVFVEHARSGRSRCIHCSGVIEQGALRFGVSARGENYTSTKFLHVICGAAFNAYRRHRHSNTITISSLQQLDTLSLREQVYVVDTLAGPA
jgi:hypothetical protein